jgi:hypothetical protein
VRYHNAVVGHIGKNSGVAAEETSGGTDETTMAAIWENSWWSFANAAGRRGNQPAIREKFPAASMEVT